MTKPLAGKVAVITGAGWGIVRAIACAYAQAGAAVVCSARKEGELRETPVSMEKGGGRSSMLTADVVEHTQIVALFDHAVSTSCRPTQALLGNHASWTRAISSCGVKPSKLT